jgi:hypothetical protein
MNALAPAFSTPAPNKLPDRFYLDLAIGTATFSDICGTYGLDPQSVREHQDDPQFQQRLLQAKQSVEDDGRAFRARCRRVVHDTIPRMQMIINDPEVPASTCVDAFKTLAKLGNLEPQPAAQANGAGGNHLTLTIIAPGGAKQETQVVGTVIQPEPGSHSLDMDDLAWCEG